MADKRFFVRQGPFNLLELLDGLDVSIPEGQFTDINIANAAPIEVAGVGDIFYYEGRAAKLSSLTLGGTACFINEDLAHIVGGQSVLAVISKTPRADFARILDRLYQPHDFTDTPHGAHKGVKIAKTAVIGSGAQIGAGTTIGPNSVIGVGVTIGENCNIGANTVIEFADIGDNCIINHGAIIGASGFGVAAGTQGGVDIPHIGSVSIGDNVSIGSQTTIDRAMFGKTEIGDGCKFDNLVHIAHNTVVGPHCMFAGQVGISGSCTIGAGVIMGGQAGVADHLSIGDGATLGGGSGLMHNIPAGETWSGFPAQPIRQHMRQIGILRKLAQKKPEKKA